jgi:hypothetical protein
MKQDRRSGTKGTYSKEHEKGTRWLSVDEDEVEGKFTTSKINFLYFVAYAVPCSCEID